LNIINTGVIRRGYTNLILYIRTISCCTCPWLYSAKSSYLLRIFFSRN